MPASTALRARLWDRAWPLLVRHYIGTGEFAEAMLRIRENPIAFPPGEGPARTVGAALIGWLPVILMLPGVAAWFLIGTWVVTPYFGSSAVYEAIRVLNPKPAVPVGIGLAYTSMLVASALSALLLPRAILPQRPLLDARMTELRLTGMGTVAILAGYSWKPMRAALACLLGAAAGAANYLGAIQVSSLGKDAELRIETVSVVVLGTIGAALACAPAVACIALASTLERLVRPGRLVAVVGASMLASAFVWRCVGGLIDVVSRSAMTSLGLAGGLDSLIFAQIVCIVLMHELLRLTTRIVPAALVRSAAVRMDA